LPAPTWPVRSNPRALVVVSARVGNFQFHPFLTVLIDQLWVRLIPGYHQVKGALARPDGVL